MTEDYDDGYVLLPDPAEEYRVVQACEPGELSRRVEQMMSWGWRPQGGVAIAGLGMRTVYGQAMVRKKGVA